METVINGVTYVGVPDNDKNSCGQCALHNSNGCTAGFHAGCAEKDIFWVRKDAVRQQVEVNKAFGHQMPLFPEIEPPVTAEEEEAFKELEQKHVTALSVLEIASDLIGNRAKDRDTESERSMLRCVKAFNAMTGHDLSEEDGWLFMQYLKQSRSRAGSFRFDDYLDDVAYAALRAECAASGKLK